MQFLLLFIRFIIFLDILLLGFLLNENAVADYKVAIILPSNLTFLVYLCYKQIFQKLLKRS